MPICAVAACQNGTYNSLFSFYSFPKDPGRRKTWVQKCRREDAFDPNKAKICAEHFGDSDFEDDIEARIMGYVRTRKLKPDAIPSHKLRNTPTPKKKKEAASLKKERMSRLNARRSLNELLESDLQEQIQSPVQEEQQEVQKMSKTCDTCLNLNIGETLKENVLLKEEIGCLKLQIQELKSHEKKLESMEHQNNNLKTRNAAITHLLEDSNRQNEKYKNLLKSLFSQSQLKVLVEEKKKVIWAAEDIKKSFALRYLSKKAYLFVKRELGIPLPALCTLSRWASKINMRTGLLEEVIQLVEIAGLSMSPTDRLCVLSYDEMKVMEKTEYDPVRECAIGPHKQMQVAVMRGLFAPYKQIIFADFDIRMTKDLLFAIIGRLKDAGFRVVACVCDNGSTNVSVWNSLQVTHERPYFDHPASGRVHVFSDVPHVLKLIRNWLLDKGFIFENGNICSEPLKDLLDIDNQEIQANFKVNYKHLECRNAQRQNVRLAAELLSHTTATALKRYLPKNEKAIATANFIDKCNLWFDVMNSYCPKSTTLQHKWAYGNALEIQNEIIDSFMEIISSMAIAGEKNKELKRFQKSALMSSNALKLLFISLKEEYGIEYILTHRLNQDVLENTFSQVRSSLGSSDHPTPLNALYKLRLIILGKNTVNILSNTNTLDASNEDHLLVEVFRRADVIPPVIDPLSSASSSPSSASSFDLPAVIDCSRDALEYLGGWLCHKFHKKYQSLNLGVRTTANEGDHCYELPSWCQQLSYGGLFRPSSEFLKQILYINKTFEKITKINNNVIKTKFVLSKIFKKCAKNKKITLPQEITKAFLKQRLIIKINFENILNKKADVRKQKSKMNKIIN